MVCKEEGCQKDKADRRRQGTQSPARQGKGKRRTSIGGDKASVAVPESKIQRITQECSTSIQSDYAGKSVLGMPRVADDARVVCPKVEIVRQLGRKPHKQAGNMGISSGV